MTKLVPPGAPLGTSLVPSLVRKSAMFNWQKAENLPSRGVQPFMYTGFVSMNLYKEGTIVCLLSMGPCVTQQMNQKRGGETLEICLLQKRRQATIYWPIREYYLVSQPAAVQSATWITASCTGAFSRTISTAGLSIWTELNQDHFSTCFRLGKT